MSGIALHDFDGDDGGSALSASASNPSVSIVSTASGHGSASIWNPANVVTCIRIALVPFFAAVALANPASHASSLAALVLLIGICLTDKLDGYLAKSRGEVTDFGKFLDPIADKLLVTAALVVLLARGDVGVASVLIILSREFIVSAVRMLAASNGEIIAAANIGRAKTAVTMVALCFLFAVPLFPFASDMYSYMSCTGHVLYAVAVVLTVVSGAQYVWNARGMFS